MTQAEEIVESNKFPSREWEDGADEVSAFCQEAYRAAKNNEELAAVADNHGLHAYRYELCGDDSVIAIYANDPEGTIKLKAFPSLEEASLWSPRDERN